MPTAHNAADLAVLALIPAEHGRTLDSIVGMAVAAGLPVAFDQDSAAVIGERTARARLSRLRRLGSVLCLRHETPQRWVRTPRGSLVLAGARNTRASGIVESVEQEAIPPR